MADCEICEGTGMVCHNCGEASDDCECKDSLLVDCVECSGSGDDGIDDEEEDDDAS
jgi:hypothetical protein